MRKKPAKLRSQRHGGAKPSPRRASSTLAEVSVVIITGMDAEGELIAAPANWDARKTPPHITLLPSKLKPAPGVHDRVLARLAADGKHRFTASVIKILPSEKPVNILGVYRAIGANGLIEPVNKREKESYFVSAEHDGGARHGELVAAETIPTSKGPHGAKCAKITERLGKMDAASSASIIAIHANNIPTRFSDAALAEAEVAEDPVWDDTREDLRKLPLITIDGEDARDFDDAVFAESDGKGGFRLIVAIADVSHYVLEGSALDADAFERGNSTYFPDRVVPMLPERLSNGLCSLKPNEPRYCLAAHLHTDANGHTTRARFTRAIMQSHARMTYTEVQRVHDSGEAHPILTPLYAAYAALARARDARGALSISLPEYKITLDASGNVKHIGEKEPLESHRLIECFMIAANVAAAEFLLKANANGIFRVHETPDELKLKDLAGLLQHMGYRLSRGEAITPEKLNRVLAKANGTPDAHIVHQSILRAQMQAYYAPQCHGHFGLALQRYCHFTSPIRRYADLVVHREITRILMGEKKGAAGAMRQEGRTSLEPRPMRATERRAAGASNIEHIASHISATERRSMQAERDAMDRYRASFMADKVGEVYAGIITSVTEAGLFVMLNDFGVTGYVPIRTLGNDFFIFDKARGELMGRRSRKVFTLGERLMVRVEVASGLTGSLLFVPENFNENPRTALTKPRSGGKKGRRK